MLCSTSDFFHEMVKLYFIKKLPYDGLCIWHPRTKFVFKTSKGFKKIEFNIHKKSIEHRINNLSMSDKVFYRNYPKYKELGNTWSTCVYHTYGKCVV